jgi:hypothetical protein
MTFKSEIKGINIRYVSPFFFILCMTLLIYSPFLSSINYGAADAQYYQYMLNDSIDQIQAGLFPPFISQSQFLPYGTALILAPMYPLLSQVFFKITFGYLSSLELQHAIVILSALGGVLSLYFCLKRLYPHLRWQIALVSFYFISSPSILSLIFSMDMYLSFVAIQFVPMIIYCLLRLNKSSSIRPYIALVLFLSFTWLSHPPIALWITLFSSLFILFGLINNSINIKYLIYSGFIFILISLYQFYGTLSLSLANSAAPWDVRPEYIVQNLQLAYPDIFHPLRQGIKGLFFLQFGYVMWFFLIFALFFLVVKKIRGSNAQLIVTTLFLITLILPYKNYGTYLWAALPKEVLHITNWPANMRIYPILAVIFCYISVSVIEIIWRNKSVRIKKIFTAIMLMGGIWNLYEYLYFYDHAKLQYSQQRGGIYLNSWEIPENIQTIFNYLPAEFVNKFTVNGMGVRPVEFNSKVLDKNQEVIAGMDNEEFVRNNCSLQNNKPVNIFSNNLSNLILDKFKTIYKFELNPSHLNFICVDFTIRSGRPFIRILNSQDQINTETEFPPIANRNERSAIIAVHKDSKLPLDNKLKNYSLSMWSGDNAEVSIGDTKIATIDPANYPIHIQSYAPYISVFKKETSSQKYLEVTKPYLDGYKAFVNNTEVKVEKSKNNYLLIPLSEIDLQHIKIYYWGTLSMRCAFYISASSLVCAFIFLLLPSINRYRRIKLQRNIS